MWSLRKCGPDIVEGEAETGRVIACCGTWSMPHCGYDIIEARLIFAPCKLSETVDCSLAETALWLRPCTTTEWQVRTTGVEYI